MDFNVIDVISEWNIFGFYDFR